MSGRTRVTRVEVDANGDEQAFVLTVMRSPADYLVVPCELPEDVKRALIGWAAGDQP